jgi:hypothetical protein
MILRTVQVDTTMCKCTELGRAAHRSRAGQMNLHFFCTCHKGMQRMWQGSVWCAPCQELHAQAALPSRGEQPLAYR